MATGKIIVYVVDVGQGQCTYVEVFDQATGQIADTLLFDCGTDGKSPTTKANITYIAGRIAGMASPKISAAFFSHSDNDHISLMKTLLNETEKLIGKVLPVGMVWYGGAWKKYTKRNFNILTYMKNRNCPENEVFAPGPDESDYVPGEGFMLYLWHNDIDVRVDLLMGNVISDAPADYNSGGTLPTGKAAEPLNRVSLVCRIKFKEQNYVVCGDATNRTMGKVCDKFNGFIFRNTIMLTLPHHGSRATALVQFPSGTNAVETIRTFAHIVQGKTLTASVGPDNKHHHPSLELTRLFVPDAVKKPIVQDVRLRHDAHFNVANIDLAMGYYPTGDAVTQGYKTFFTESNVYATWYYWPGAVPDFGYSYKFNEVNGVVPVTPLKMPTGLPAINEHACWLYQTDSLKNVSMWGIPQLTGDASKIFTEAASGNFTGSGAGSAETRNAVSQKFPPRVTSSMKPPARVVPRTLTAMRSFR